MALTLGDNFSYQGQKPLDARLKYNTVADMKAVGDATMYDGCMAYCSGTDKTYQWKSTNSVDETTGRWREFSSGGGGGSYTAGDGIDITNDVISTKQSQEGDIDEIIDVYPQAGDLVSIVNAFNRGDIYSTSERMIGQWHDGKPIYQRVLDLGTMSLSSSTTHDDIDISTWNLETLIDCKGGGVAYKGTALQGNVTFPQNYISDLGLKISIKVSTSGDLLVVYKTISASGTFTLQNTFIIVQYTKTTDTAISIGEATEYSTGEKVVGTWVDGKPIFQKTIETTTPTCTSQGTQAEKYVEIGEEVERFISVEGFFRIPNTADMPLNSVFKANSTITYSLVRGNPNIATNNPNTIYISVSNTNWSDRTCYVTFQYTKTTS